MKPILTRKMDRAAHRLWWQAKHEPLAAAAWIIWLIWLAKRDWAELPASTHAMRLVCQRLLVAGMIERRAGGVRISEVGERLLMLLDSQGHLSRLKAAGLLDERDCLPPWLQAPPPPPGKPSNSAA